MQEIDIIYNSFGSPVLRLLSNGRLVDYNGKSIGFIEEDCVYDYNGVHVGWYIDGIFRDHNGCCVGFGNDVQLTPHPLLPIKQICPISGFIEFEPFRPFRGFPPLKPVFFMGWSSYNPISIFKI